MSFIPKDKTTVTITLKMSSSEAGKVSQHLQTLADNLTPQEMELLSKAVRSPMIKHQALQALNNYKSFL